MTNAFLEGINRVFSATQRKARGYHASYHHALLRGRNLRLPPLLIPPKTAGNQKPMITSLRALDRLLEFPGGNPREDVHAALDAAPLPGTLCAPFRGRS